MPKSKGTAHHDNAVWR